MFLQKVLSLHAPLAKGISCDIPYNFCTIDPVYSFHYPIKISIYQILLRQLNQFSINFFSQLSDQNIELTESSEREGECFKQDEVILQF